MPVIDYAGYWQIVNEAIGIMYDSFTQSRSPGAL